MGWVLKDCGVVGKNIAPKPFLVGEEGLEQAGLGWVIQAGR